MARKSSVPLEKKDVILFEGDWDELTAYLAPLKIKPTVFIRALVHKKLLEIRAKAAEQQRPTPELSDDFINELAADATESTPDGGTDEPE